jgi:predicted urease superfamily metal-dependent hydrolase
MIRRIIIKWLGKWLGVAPVVDVVPRMSDAEILAAMAIEVQHPVYAATLEIVNRARQDARDQARAVVGNHAECSYYLGAEWAMENLREYLANTRREALLQAKEQAENS